MVFAASQLAVPAGRTVRFQVQHPELGTGSSWSLTTHKRTGDVYVVHREGGVWVKASFHHSGQWHFGVTGAGQQLVPGGDAYLAVSQEINRVPFAAGWAHAMRITVARSELRHHSEAVRAKRLVRAGMPWKWDAVALEVYLGDPGASLILHSPASVKVLAYMERGDGGRVILLRRPCWLEDDIHDVFAEAIAEAKTDLADQGWDGAPTRIVIFGTDDSADYLREVEVAID